MPFNVIYKAGGHFHAYSTKGGGTIEHFDNIEQAEDVVEKKLAGKGYTDIVITGHVMAIKPVYTLKKEMLWVPPEKLKDGAEPAVVDIPADLPPN